MDIFKGDAFGLISMSDAMDLAPYAPRMLGAMKLFRLEPVRTTVVAVESREGKLSILKTGVRGTVEDVYAAPIRRARNFTVPHIPYFGFVMADEVQNIRTFGSETELQSVAGVVNEKLAGMREDHEVTREFHRVNALKGILVDSDNSTVIYNFYTEFGTSQQTSNFAVATDKPMAIANDVAVKIGTSLGGAMFGQIIALCGNAYYNAMAGHADVLLAYERWAKAGGQPGDYLREGKLGSWYSLAMNSFTFGNIIFVNYRGTIGNVDFIPTDEAYYFPADVPGMFSEICAPADFAETVNTLGRPFYARQEPIRFNKGIQLHTQSNILAINKRPRAVVKSTRS